MPSRKLKEKVRSAARTSIAPRTMFAAALAAVDRITQISVMLVVMVFRRAFTRKAAP